MAFVLHNYTSHVAIHMHVYTDDERRLRKTVQTEQRDFTICLAIALKSLYKCNRDFNSVINTYNVFHMKSTLQRTTCIYT